MRFRTKKKTTTTPEATDDGKLVKTRKRIAKSTTTLPSGVRITTAKIVEAYELEWKLQAEAVRQLKELPEFDKEFTLAADMNSAKRSRNMASQAKATGIAAGDPDLRIYGRQGRLLLIEYKAGDGTLNKDQRTRHPLLASLGHPVTVIKADTPERCAALTLSTVRTWLAANDNVVGGGCEFGKVAKEV